MKPTTLIFALTIVLLVGIANHGCKLAAAVPLAKENLYSLHPCSARKLGWSLGSDAPHILDFLCCWWCDLI